ncbi:MAG: hypothetical protein R2867_15455 [Caldilineaceae bacterium]
MRVTAVDAARLTWMIPGCNSFLPLLLSLILFLSLPQPALAHGFVPQPVDPSPLVARGQDKQGFITVTLRADRAVTPGETVNLIVEAQPTLDAAALTVQWGLPDGGEFLNGVDQITVPTVRATKRSASNANCALPTLASTV